MARKPERYRTVDGKGFDRLNAFSDGVFAIAITILALTLDIPHLTNPTNADLFHALLKDLPQFVAFVLSFVIVGRYWVIHHDLFSMMRAYDNKVLWLNLLLLLTIVFLPFPTNIVSEYSELPAAFAFYYGSIALVGMAELALYRYILRRPELHNPNHSWVTERYHQRVALLVPLVFIVAIPISLANVFLGQWVWVLIFLVKARRK